MGTYQLVVVKEIDYVSEAIKEAKKAEIIDSAYTHNKVIKVLYENSMIYDNGYYSFDFFRNSICRYIFDHKLKVYVRGYKNSVAISVHDNKIELYTQDKDEELFGGKVVKKGQVVFKVTRESIITDGDKEREFEISGVNGDFTMRIEEDIFHGV